MNYIRNSSCITLKSVMVRTIKEYFDTVPSMSIKMETILRDDLNGLYPPCYWLPLSFILYPQRNDVVPPAIATRSLSFHVREERRRLAQARDERASFLEAHVSDPRPAPPPAAAAVPCISRSENDSRDRTDNSLGPA